jgi:hypothetical protein
VDTSVDAIVKSNEGMLEVIEPEKKMKKKGYTNSGHLSAKAVSIEHKPSFADVRASVSSKYGSSR